VFVNLAIVFGMNTIAKRDLEIAFVLETTAFPVLATVFVTKRIWLLLTEGMGIRQACPGDWSDPVQHQSF
jgi:hypothetical protein